MARRNLAACFAAVLAAAAAGACGQAAPATSAPAATTDAPPAPTAPSAPTTTVDVPAADAAVTVDAVEPAPTVEYVETPVEADRVYFYEPGDEDRVYYYVNGSPDVVLCLDVVHANGRTYCVERSGDVERRVLFDERAARARHFDRADRERFVREARERAQHERTAWDQRWTQRRTEWEHRRPTRPAPAAHPPERRAPAPPPHQPPAPPHEREHR